MEHFLYHPYIGHSTKFVEEVKSHFKFQNYRLSILSTPIHGATKDTIGDASTTTSNPLAKTTSNMSIDKATAATIK